MLKPEMIARLNEQLNLEFYSSNLYLQMSAWCDKEGYEGAASFLKEHAIEEREHMQRLFDYLTDTDALAEVGTIAAPPTEYESLIALFETTLEHEKLITEKINDLVDYALITKDFPTFNFLQWFVAEQHEEEKLFKNVIDRLIIANQGGGLLVFDKEMGGRSSTASA